MSVLRSEWIKTRTIRMNWVLFVIAISFRFFPPIGCL